MDWQLDKFKKQSFQLLDSLSTFAPTIEGMKNLAEVKLTDEMKEITDQFAIDGKGKTMAELMVLKDECLEKLKNVRK